MQNIDPALALKAIKGTVVSKQLNPLWPEITQSLASGVSHESIVSALNENGISITLATFHKYLYRYRKRGGHEAQVIIHATPATPALPIAQNGNSEPAVSLDESVAEPEETQVVGNPLNLLTDEKSREEFANQYMQRPPLRKRNKT